MLLPLRLAGQQGTGNQALPGWPIGLRKDSQTTYLVSGPQATCLRAQELCFSLATNTQHACSSLHHTRPRGLARRATPAFREIHCAGRNRKVKVQQEHSHTSQAENVGWSLSLLEWPFGQDPRCPGCVFHCSPHYPSRAPRAHARAHTPGYSSWRRVSPCGPPPLSTVVGTSYQPHRKCKAPPGAEPLYKR